MVVGIVGGGGDGNWIGESSDRRRGHFRDLIILS